MIIICLLFPFIKYNLVEIRKNLVFNNLIVSLLMVMVTINDYPFGLFCSKFIISFVLVAVASLYLLVVGVCIMIFQCITSEYVEVKFVTLTFRLLLSC